MFVRIVKLIIKTEEISSFKTMFDEKKSLIRNFPGCQFLELYQDKKKGLSSPTAAETVWAETKLKFNGKPEAWSVNKLVSLS